MAYRRRQGISRASTFKEEVQHDHTTENSAASSSSASTASSSLAAQAIRASSAHRDSSLSSAYQESAFAFRDSDRQKSFPAARSTDAPSYEYTSMKSLNESKYGFWGVLAKKAKQILEDDNVAQQFNKPGKAGNQMLDIPSDNVFHQSHQSPESSRKTDNPSMQRRLDAFTSSLSTFGGTIGKSLEEGLTMVENRTADIIQETRKLHIRKKGSNLDTRDQASDANNPQQQVQMQTNPEMQLKASRDVRCPMCVAGSHSRTIMHALIG